MHETQADVFFRGAIQEQATLVWRERWLGAQEYRPAPRSANGTIQGGGEAGRFPPGRHHPDPAKTPT